MLYILYRLHIKESIIYYVKLPWVLLHYLLYPRTSAPKDRGVHVYSFTLVCLSVRNKFSLQFHQEILRCLKFYHTFCHGMPYGWMHLCTNLMSTDLSVYLSVGYLKFSS
jgi:hypothetical protein